MSIPLLRRVLADGRILEVWRYIFNHRLTIADPQHGGMYFADQWCYHDLPTAERAFNEWDGDGEPAGWMKHPTTGRYMPNGDPARETVNR